MRKRAMTNYNHISKTSFSLIKTVSGGRGEVETRKKRISRYFKIPLGLPVINQNASIFMINYITIYYFDNINFAIKELNSVD